MLRVGCQTYPWKMGHHFGEIPHILDIARDAGFTSLEAEIDMLGPWFNDPKAARDLFNEKHMSLSCLVLHQDWEGCGQTKDEWELTRRALAFLREFPFAKLMVSHHAGGRQRGEGAELEKRRENLMTCMNQAAVEAAEYGIITGFHPNSAANSLFRTKEDYEVMFQMLSGTRIAWVPDVGHMENGGFSALEMMKAHREFICHVHFKDRLRENVWAVMGEGNIDYPTILKWLQEIGYKGWIMVEDESPKAAGNSDAVVRADGAYMMREIAALEE